MKPYIISTQLSDHIIYAVQGNPERLVAVSKAENEARIWKLDSQFRGKKNIPSSETLDCLPLDRIVETVNGQQIVEYVPSAKEKEKIPINELHDIIIQIQNP